MTDILDPNSDVLYCSVTCAKKAGVAPTDCVIFTEQDYDKACEESLTGNPYGARCPICGKVYHSF